MANVNQVVQKPVKQVAQSAKPIVAGQQIVVAEKKPLWKRWWLWAIVVLVIAGLIIWMVV